MADIVIPHTFSPNTLIESAKVNANFTQLSTNAFNKVEGDTCEGPAVFEDDVSVAGDLTVTGSITGLTIDASTLSGTTLAAGITVSSLTSVGTITSGTWSGSFGAVSGANLTTLNANELDSGTVPVTRISGLTTTNFANAGVSQWANDAGYLTAGSTGGVPPGTITMFGGAAAPAEWLLCQGQSLLRADYTALFAVIGTTYGTVDGTHFTLPNLQQRFPLGFNTGGGVGGTLGETGGLVDHTHTGPSHTHTVDPVSTTTTGGGAHGHSISGTVASGGNHRHRVRFDTSSVSVNHTHSFSTTVDGDHAHSVSGFGVTTGSDNVAASDADTSTTGDHSHTGTTGGTNESTSHVHALDNYSDYDGAHDHTAGTLAVVSATDHTHAVDIASTTTSASGTGITGTANPPYLTLNFIIKY